MNAIIIQYDKRPNATIDEKLQSLIESIQLALYGMGEQDYAYQTSQDKGMEAVIVAIRQAEESISTNTSSIGNLSDRLDTAEGSLSTLEDTTIPSIQGDVSDLDDRLDTLEGTVGGHTTDISGLDGRLDTLEDTTIPGIDTRVGALEGKIPAAPVVDGAYKLTVTVTDGVPVYTWELA